MRTGQLRADGRILWEDSHTLSDYVVESERYAVDTRAGVGDTVYMSPVDQEERINPSHRYNVSLDPDPRSVPAPDPDPVDKAPGEE